MRLTLLGTGSAFPSPHRLQTGFHLMAGDDSLVIDCGSGVMHRLEQAGISYRDVDTVLLTHPHLDHVADLPTLFKARILAGDPAFSVIGPPGTREVCDTLFAVDASDERGEAVIQERTVDAFPLHVEGFDIAAVETTHGAPCFAYRFGDDLVISGDSAPDPAVFDLADGCHTLVHECSYPDGMGTAGHSTPGGIVDAVRDISIDRFVLTHLFPAAEANMDAMARTLREGIDAEVIVGSDRQVLSVPD